MITIWKYPLFIEGNSNSIQLPKGAEFLHLAVQDGQPTMWFKVDSEAIPEIRIFKIYGTGHTISTEYTYKYLGTIEHLYGLIFHVFEIITPVRL